VIQPFGPEERELLRKSYRHNSDVLDLLGLLEEAEAERDKFKRELAKYRLDDTYRAARLGTLDQRQSQ
jgi:hypothetical protein